jgi:hypothetical protein
MEINRNQVFMIGFVVLMLGIQFRAIESFTLNEQATKALAKHMQKSQVASSEWIPSLYVGMTPPRNKTVTPPKWVGWALIATGTVLVLQSLAMPRPS